MGGVTTQLTMFPEHNTPSEPAKPAPDNLVEYDAVVVNSSAGKDSLAMLDVVCEQATAAGCLSRVLVLHCDLGRMEWPGTRELAESQAQRYGVRFDTVGRRQGNLLTHVEQRGMWPSPRQRYCTSDHKRAQAHRMLTALTDFQANERRLRGERPRPARILNCMGMRADESPARAKKAPFARNEAASNSRRQVDDWLPLHAWTEPQVWARIHESRAADLVHPAYALGMPRLSCVFCIFAPPAALILAGKHNPELLAEYVAVEKRIGHKFRVDLSLADVQAAVNAGQGGPVENWRM